MLSLEHADRLRSGPFYTYLHRTSDTGAVFYIGKGCGSRANDRIRRSEHWLRVVRKHGLTVEVVAPWETEQEAFDHEVFLVDTFRALGAKLVNQTDGGGGMTGWTASPETRARMSVAQSRPAVAAKKSASISARKQTPEAKALNSRIAKARWAGPSRDKRLSTIRSPEFRAAAAQRRLALGDTEAYQTAHTTAMQSPEVLEKLRAGMSTPEYKAAHAARMKRVGVERQKKVLCVETGVVFDSGKQAAEAMGLLRSKVSKVCNGKATHTHGYTFRFIEESAQ